MRRLRKNRHQIQCDRRSDMLRSFIEKNQRTQLSKMQSADETTRKQIRKILGMRRVSHVRRIVKTLRC